MRSPSRLPAAVVAALLGAAALLALPNQAEADCTSGACTSPGCIVRAVGASGQATLNPDGNQCTSSGGYFTTDDHLQSELPFVPIPQAISVEPLGDLQTGSNGSITDLVDTTGGGRSTFVYFSKGADGVADTDDDKLVFRLRIGSNGTGAFGESVLIDTDVRFGTTGTRTDPNAVSGNPGFELEVILHTGNAGNLSLYDVDGTKSGRLLKTYTGADYQQRSIALTTAGGDADYFFDFFIDFKDLDRLLPSARKVFSTSPLRIISATSSSPNSALGGSASDIGGVNDSDASFGGDDARFVTQVAAVPTSTFGRLESGGGFGPTVQFAATSSATSEGSGTASIAVTLSAVSVLDVTIPITFGGTATGAADYVAPAATVTIAAGSASTNINVPIVNDALAESPETITATMGTPTNATLGSVSVHTLNLNDDDGQPVVALSTASQSVSESAGSIGFSVTLSSVLGADVTLPVTYSGTATNTSDYSGAPASITIPAGSSSVVGTVTILDDAVVDAGETLIVTLGAVSTGNAVLGAPAVQTITIVDDEPVIQFSAAAQTVAESVGTVTVTVSRNSSSGSSVVPVAFSGTATSGTDYTVSSSSVTIANGSSSGTLTFTLANDAVKEGTKTVIVTLGTPGSGSIGATSVHTVTITDDDPMGNPSVGFTSLSQDVNEGTAGSTTTVTLTAELSAVHTATVTATLSVSNTSTTTGSGGSRDYNLPSPFTISIPAGSLTGTTTFTTVDDGTVEATETVVVDVASASNGSVGAQSRHTVNVVDDDPKVNFSVATQSKAESAGTATVTVTLSGAHSEAVVVPIATSGTATSGTDFSGLSSITVPIGATTASGTITITNDVVDEVDETIVLALEVPSNAGLGTTTTTQTITITDDDDEPSVAFSTAAQNVAEAAAGTVTVTLSAASARTVSVPVTVRGASVATSGVDYTAPAASITVAPGATSGSLTLTTLDDAVDETNETVILDLGTPTNATLGATTSQTVTIVDDDGAPTVALSAATATVSEGAGSATVTATLSAASGQTVTVAVSAGAGSTATSLSDYALGAGSIVIAAGATSGTVTLTVVDDGLDEADETVVLELGAVSNASLGATTSQTVTIGDNDGAPTVSFGAATGSVGEASGTGVTVTATLSGASGRAVTVPLTVTGTATGGGTDYTLGAGNIVIAAGITSGSVAITPVDDALVEGDETVIVTMGTLVNADAGATTATTITLVDDDAVPVPTVSVSVSAASAVEGAGGAVTVTATLSAATGSVVTVPVSFAGTASGAGVDYTTSATSITIGIGATIGTLTLSTVDDAVDETNETVILDLGTPTNATLGATTSQTVTIVDDDPAPVVDAGADIAATSDAAGPDAGQADVGAPDAGQADAGVADVAPAPASIGFASAAQTVLEASAPGVATATVTLSRPLTSGVVLALGLSGSATAGTDYESPPTTITIAAGATSVAIVVPILPDDRHERDEVILLTLTAPSDVVFAPPLSHSITIVDDDPPPSLRFAAAALTVGEGAATATFTLTLSAPSVDEVTVPLAVTGTAAAGADFTGDFSPLVIPPGVQTVDRTITILSDDLPEPSETVIVALGIAVNATLGSPAVHTVTITDDDGGDADGDGLADGDERRAGTDPNDADSDDDGLPDGDEPAWDGDADADGAINARDPDSDGDGIRDGTERGITTPGPGTDLARGIFVPDADPTSTTDPGRADSDDGGLADGAEDVDRNGRVDAGERDPRVGGDDNRPTETTIVNGPGAQTTEPTAAFQFSSWPVGARIVCRLDGGASFVCGPTWVSPALSPGAHELIAQAIDAAGRVDDTPAVHGWVISSPVVRVTITAGPPPLTNATSATFLFEREPANALLECSLDDGAFNGCVSGHTVVGLGDGAHRLVVRPVGVAAAAVAHAWTVDATAPGAIAISGPPALTSSRTPRFVFSSLDPMATFSCALDDGAFAPCTSPLVLPPLADGEHILRVRATDSLGNTDREPIAFRFVVDATPPETTVANGPGARVGTGEASFRFAATEPATFACSLDGAPYQPCLETHSVAGLASGPHLLSVRATDQAGNVDPTPATHAWTVFLDADQDGVGDEEEQRLGLNPLDSDSDDDGVSDGVEALVIGDHDADGAIAGRDTDSDGDGVLDGTERGIVAPGPGTNVAAGAFRPDEDPTTTTDPLLADNDGGGTKDGVEDANRNGRVDGDETDPSVARDDDEDGDRIPNAAETTTDFDGDGIGNWLDLDADGDTILDRSEAGDDDRATAPLDVDGDSAADFLDLDADGDGVTDATEAGDSDLATPPLDTDSDGTPDFRDRDSDGDAVDDAIDNCRLVSNPNQADANHDGTGDACTNDRDGDGIVDGRDNCPAAANPDQADADANGVGDRCEVDRDGDGFEDDVRVAGGRACSAAPGAPADGPSAGWAALLLVVAGVVARGRRSRGFRRGRFLGLGFGLVLLGISTPGRAQLREEQGFPLDRLRLAIDGEGLINVDAGRVPEPGTFHLLLWGEGARNSLVLYRQDSPQRLGALVKQRFDASAGLAWVATPWLELAIDLPIVIRQWRDDRVAGVTQPLAPLDSGGLGDVRLAAKLPFAHAERAGIDLALLLRGTLPTGAAQSYFVESGATFVPGLALSRQFANGVRLAFNGGYRFRRQVRLLDLEVDDEIEVKGGGGWFSRTDAGHPFGFETSLFASTAAAHPLSRPGNDPVEALAAASFGRRDGLLAGFVGGALGLHEGYGTSDWRVFTGARVVLGIGDTDRDGLPDALDRCPPRAEDRDDFEDGDGCPDEDDDADGVADAADRCPLSAGSVEAFGCPSGAPRIDLLSRDGAACVGSVGGPGSCALRGRVVFAPRAAALPEGSAVVLDEIAAALRARTNARLRILGYADEEPTTAANLSLATNRAEALRRALVDRGVPADRLSARGVGALAANGRGYMGPVVEIQMTAP